jgi:midasin (ATPase involved in ribosome maturation)
VAYKTIQENLKSIAEVKKVDIDTFSSDQFSEEASRYIPDLPKEFQLDVQMSSVVNAVVHGDALAVLLHGPAGTGKTIACKLICEKAKLPLIETINATENLDEFVLGKYLPEDDKIIFKESFVTKAIRDGGAVVFEEINFAKPQYLAFLNSLLDDNGFVRIDNGEVVKRHENFRFFATMNMGYFGTKELNQALFNRFNIVVELDELSDASIERMLLARVPQSKEYLTKILGVYHKLKKKIETDELDVVLSPRNLENWAKLAKYEGYLLSAEKTIIPIAKNDRYFEKSIRDILMLYKWK